MKIFANLCDPHSFINAFKNAGQTFTLSALTANNMFTNNSISPTALTTNFPTCNLKVPVTGQRVFAKIWIDYISMHASYVLNRDPRRIIEIYNASGKVIASLGFNTSNTSYGTDVQPLAMFTWNDAGGVVTSKVDTVSGYKPLGVFSNYGNRTPDRALSYDYYVDPVTPANSYFRAYYGAELLLQMSGAEMSTAADPLPAKCVFFATNWSGSSLYCHRVAYIVVTDTMDLSLEPAILRPAALTSSTDFTGTVTAIQEILQDSNYISCSAEVGKYIEFTIQASGLSYSLLPVAASKIVDIRNSVFLRYVQAGGTAITFTVSLMNGTTVLSSVDVSVAANEDDTYYQTKFLTALQEIIGGSVTQLAQYTARIALKEV